MGNSKTKKYLSDNVFNTEVQYCGHIFTTPSGDGTAIRAKPLAGQRKRRVYASRIRQTANVRFKLRISQNRKCADKNSSKQFLWIKSCVNY